MEIVHEVFAIDLADSEAGVADYEAAHRPGAIWPEVVADLRARGYCELKIWRAGTRLVMIAARDANACPSAADGATEARLAEWDKWMAGFQRAIDGADAPVWTPLHCIFDLTDHTNFLRSENPRP